MAEEAKFRLLLLTGLRENWNYKEAYTGNWGTTHIRSFPRTLCAKIKKRLEDYFSSTGVNQTRWLSMVKGAL